MQSDGGRSPEREKNKVTLFIPHLPASLASWKPLKSHFSQFGNVVQAIVNPQQRSGIVNFKTEDDAKNAKENGCFWQNKELKILYWTDALSNQVDPRAFNVSLRYNEFDSNWEDDDMDYFGVVEKSQKPESVNKEQLPVMKSARIKQNTKSVFKRISKQETVKHSKLLEKTSKSKAKGNYLYEVAAKKKVRKVQSKSQEDNSLSLKAKLALLEERDKLIRKSFVKTSNVKLAKAVVGTCPDMCPEKERIMREYQRLVSVYEMIPGSQKMDPSLAVKAYSRSSADQEEPLPHDLRPEPVLTMTMVHIISNIMTLVEDPDVNVSDWYDFCWDRLRGIRKDIIQQQLCDLKTVAIIEQCARFHIVCYDRLWGIDRRVFDEKINTENLMNCLQSLRHMYEDLSKMNIKCPNEDEFNAYMILLNMRTGDLISEYRQFSAELQTKDAIQFAVKVYLAFNNSMYSQFFKLVKQSTYLNSCLLQRYFYQVRVQAIQAIARAYCPPKKGGNIPLRQVMKILKFDDSDDAKLFCEGHGFILKDKSYFEIYRNDFYFPETPVKINTPSSLVISKRLRIAEAVIGHGETLHTYEKHEVHNSFTSDGKLTDTAMDASDQKVKKITLASDKDDDYCDENFEELPEIVVDEMVESNWQDESFSMEVDEENTDSGNAIGGFCQQKGLEDNEIKNSEPINVFKFSVEQTPPSVLRKASISPTVKKSPSPKVHKAFEFFTNKQQETNHFKSTLSQGMSSSPLQEHKIETMVTEQIPLSQRFDFGGNRLSFTQSGEGIFSPKSIGKSGLVWGKKDSGSKFYEYKREQSMESLQNDVKPPKCDEIGGDVYKKTELFFTDYVEIDKEEKQNQDIPRSLYEGEIDKNDGGICAADTNIFEDEVEDKISSPKVKTKRDRYPTMKKLKRDLRQRLKVITARHYVRKWKRKVEKMKQRRVELPFLNCIPIDQHISIWGSVRGKRPVPPSVLHRLQEKRRCVKTTSTVLEEKLQNSVPFLGLEIARNIALSSSSILSIKDFNIPICWKLAVSIPFSIENNSFLVDKFCQWTGSLFYGTGEASSLGTVMRVNTSHNECVHYSASVVTSDDIRSQQKKLIGICGLLFISVDGQESTVEKCDRLQKLIGRGKKVKGIPVAVINIGRKIEDKILTDILHKSKRTGHVSKWQEEYWKDFSSVVSTIKFLTTDVNLSTEVKASTLASVLGRLTENLFSAIMMQINTDSSDFSVLLKDPNNLISFYNYCFQNLELILSQSKHSVSNVVPPEFKKYVQATTSIPKERDPKLSKSRTMHVAAALNKLQLPKLSDWPPNSSDELVEILASYCSSVGCRSLLPQIVRIIDVQDDTDLKIHLPTVPWAVIVDMLVRRIIQRDYTELKQLVVLYSDSEFIELYEVEQCYNTLHRFFVEACT